MRGAAAADKIITNGDPALNDAASHTSFDVYFQGDNSTDVADNDILLSVNEDGKQGAEGGAGNDSFEFVNTSGVVGEVIASGGAGDDSFEFSSDLNNANVARLTLSDIAGGAGEDTFDLRGGTQSTTVRGGAGVDTFTLRGDYNNTILKGGADGDFFQIGTRGVADGATISLTNSRIRGQGGNDGGMLFDKTVSADSSTINGNAGNDEIRFTAAFGTVTGLTIGGGTGDDLIIAVGDADADGIQFNGGTGIDSITSGAGDDLINGGNGPDTMISGDGTDSILGGAGHDFADGEAGNDTINGEAGNDTLEGGAGDDSVLGGDGNDSVLGEAGNDFLSGEAGNDTINGGIGNDSLVGGDGADEILTGDNTGAVGYNSGDDTVVGGADGDFIFLGGNNLNTQIDLDDNTVVINAITDSEAATGEFDVISGFRSNFIGGAGTVADPTDAARNENLTIDVEAVKDVLAGSNATEVAIADLGLVATAGATTADRFESLLDAFNTPGAPLMNASDDTTLRAYTFEATGLSTAGVTRTYLVMNDPNNAMTAGDLLMEIPTGVAAGAGASSLALLQAIDDNGAGAFDGFANQVIDLG